MKLKGNKKILIIAGGTGGHIFPALAIADYLTKQDVEIHWLGTQGRMEEKIIPGRYPIFYIDIGAIRGKGFSKKIIMPWQLLRATIAAYKIIRQLNPDMVLAMGGYVAGPGGLAAKLARKPLIIHEQNAAAGLTNRWLAKFADQILQAFPGAFSSSIPKQRLITTGNPVRDDILKIKEPEERFAEHLDPLRVLILGGSQGAQILNRVMIDLAKQYPYPEKIEIWHQSGAKDQEALITAYTTNNIKAKVTDFITDMSSAYGWADLIIGRAGASTVSEIAAAGVGSILIPLPWAADNHQWHNARFLEKSGGAIIVEEPALSAEELICLLIDFANNRNQLTLMAVQAKKLAYLNATENVALICQQFL